MLLPLALVLAAAPADLATSGAPGLRAIHGDALSAHIRFLADDLLEGRGTGTRGHALAARYLATQLQALGFEPAGERGTWFQSVPLTGMSLQPQQCALEIDGHPLRYGEEVLFAARARTAHDAVAGEAVFVGYGISAPEYGYEDAPRDLQGRIAVVLAGAPRSERMDFFPAAASAVYSDLIEKVRLLAARGAAAVVVVNTPEREQHIPWSLAVRMSQFERMVWRDAAGGGSGLALPVAYLPSSGLERLLAGTGQQAADLFARGPRGELRAFPLRVRTRLRVEATLRDLTSENVVGVLRGGERAREHVVLSAHLDHLGIGPPVNGDSIYNGAHDDAAGVAGVIEIARAFASLPARPPRSVLVVGATGEEHGMLGSDYYARHPTVPIGDIVADVNLDGPSGAWEPHDLVALGADHSTLGATVRTAAAALGLRVSPDPSPASVGFIRSDQYSFVRRGVPSLFPHVGLEDAKGDTRENRARAEWWGANRYHQPSDEWDPSLDYESMAKEVRAEFLIALAITLDPERPRWLDGDVFGKLFARPGREEPRVRRPSPSPLRSGERE